MKIKLQYRALTFSLNNKKGSSSVFLVFIMSAMIGVTAVFVYAAKQTAYTGIGDGLLNMSMRSVMSEFNLQLKDGYDLMAFENSSMEAAFKIEDYVEYTFEKGDPVSDIKVTFGDYPLSNVNTLRQQILEYMKLAVAKDVLSDNGSDFERTEIRDRTLRNRSVIKMLPSRPFEESGDGFLEKLDRWKEKLGSPEDIFKEVSDEYLLDLYITTHFKYATGGPIDEPTFFDNEVEYIITGDYGNEKNRKTVEKGLKLLRTALNTTYIYSDEKKRAETLAAAELLTPEAALATQAVLITTWASAEAENDVNLLLKGRPVPFMKDAASWATDLQKVLDNITEDCIDPGNKKGLYYSDYLMIFLHFEDENIKLARIADLIQLNMKGTYDRDFTMKESNGGMHLSTKIYGKEMEYETRY